MIYTKHALTKEITDLFDTIERGISRYVPSQYMKGKTFAQLFMEHKDAWEYVRAWFAANGSPIAEVINWQVVEGYKVERAILEPEYKNGIKISWSFNVGKNNSNHSGSKILENGVNEAYLDFKRVLLGVIGNIADKDTKRRKAKSTPQKVGIRKYWHYFYTVEELRKKINQNARYKSGRTTMWNAQLTRKDRDLNKAYAALEKMVKKYLAIEKTGYILDFGRKIPVAGGRGFDLLNKLSLDINLSARYLQRQKIDRSQSEVATCSFGTLETKDGHPQTTKGSMMSIAGKLQAVSEIDLRSIRAELTEELMVDQRNRQTTK